MLLTVPELRAIIPGELADLTDGRVDIMAKGIEALIIEMQGENYVSGERTYTKQSLGFKSIVLPRRCDSVSSLTINGNTITGYWLSLGKTQVMKDERFPSGTAVITAHAFNDTDKRKAALIQAMEVTSIAPPGIEMQLDGSYSNTFDEVFARDDRVRSIISQVFGRPHILL